MITINVAQTGIMTNPPYPGCPVRVSLYVHDFYFFQWTATTYLSLEQYKLLRHEIESRQVEFKQWETKRMEKMLQEKTA